MNYSQMGDVGYRASGQFKPLFLDFVEGKLFQSEIYPYQNEDLDYEELFKSSAKKEINRKLLVECLQDQYSKINFSGIRHYSKIQANFELLLSEDTFTVCTGHQLCIFGGPLFLLTKIISVINKCENLKKRFPKRNFIPIFWMASEDHDIDEIRSISVFNNKIIWETKEHGKSGKLSTSGLNDLVGQVESIIENTPSKNYIIQILKKSYSDFDNLADATRYFIHELFAEYGLVILDGDDKRLKESFKDVVLKDIVSAVSFHKVNETIEILKQKNYNIQVNPREINYFFTTTNLRERMVLENGKIKVDSVDKINNISTIHEWISNEIENISPNVVTRPLYQQSILPNIEYVGGPGEISYWLEYYSMFKEFNITYPILTARDFMALIDGKSYLKIKDVGLELEDLFVNPDLLYSNYLKRMELLFTVNEEKVKLEELKSVLIQRISKIDPSLEMATEANFQKFYGGLDQLAQKVNRSIKQRQEVTLKRIEQVRNKILPENSLMERIESSISFIANDEKLIHHLKEVLMMNKEKNKILIIANN